MSRKVTIALDDDLHSAATLRAAEAGVTVSSWCHAAVLHALRRVPTLRAEPLPTGLGAASGETRQAVASSGGRTAGRGRPKAIAAVEEKMAKALEQQRASKSQGDGY